MASEDTPRSGLDRAIGALRLMLISAQDDDAARRQLLPALCRCKVFVPTWPNAPGTVRVLMSPTGAVTMPLFTGRDALEHAAKKFHWHEGGTSFRHLDARQALRGAAAQAVQFIAVDVGAEHAIEVPCEEVERFLQQGPQGADDEAADEPSTGQRNTRDPLRSTAERSPSRSTAERSASRSTMAERIERALAAEREPEQVHVRERKPSVTVPLQAADFSAAGPQVAAPRVAAPPIAAPPIASAPAGKKRGLAEIDDPFASVPGRPAPVKARPDSGGVARRVQSGAATPLARHMPSAPFQSQLPPRPASRPEPERGARSPLPHAQTEPMIPPAPRPPVAAQVAEVAPLIEAAFVRADNDYDFGGGAAGAAPASEPVRSLEVNKMPAASRATLSDAPPQPREPAAPFDAPVAAAREPIAPAAPTAREVAATPIAAAEPAKPAQQLPQPQPQPVVAAPAVAPVAKEAPAEQPRDRISSTGDLQEPFETIDDAVLSAIADDLRKYPEVEWACELSDGSELPVIGVRIEPSYLARAPEIEAHVRKVARERKTSVQVLLLTENAPTKQARAVGRMFFPWKKKR